MFNGLDKLLEGDSAVFLLLVLIVVVVGLVRVVGILKK